MTYSIFTNAANSLKMKLFPLGSDRYNILIENISSNQINLREEFQKKVNEVCGTRFEIESIELAKANQDTYEKPTIQGSFKCFVNSQM